MREREIYEWWKISRAFIEICKTFPVHVGRKLSGKDEIVWKRPKAFAMCFAEDDCLLWKAMCVGVSWDALLKYLQNKFRGHVSEM